MFAPKITKARTKAPESPTRKLMPQPSAPVARPFGGRAVEPARMLQGTIGNQATTHSLTQLRPNLPAKPERHGQQAAPENVTAREAPRNVSWDFSKTPIFPPDRASRPQFSRIPIVPSQSAAAGRAATACNSRLPKAAESLGAPEPDDNNRYSQSPGPVSGAAATSGSGSGPPSASLSVTSAGYVDSASASNKSVTFNATWSGGAQEDYILVQWLKGYIKKPDGTPYKVTMYGSEVDFNFADFQIDSVDADPAYWSAGGTRWNYTVGSGNTFSASDAPGPMFDTDGAGAKANLDFKIAVYKSADVPATTSGSIAATPVSSWHTWTYHVNVLGGGRFSHG